MRKTRNRHEAMDQAENVANKIAPNQPYWTVLKLRSRNFTGKLLFLLKPLAIFMPRKRTNGRDMDYNLLLLVLAFSLYDMVFVGDSVF